MDLGRDRPEERGWQLVPCLFVVRKGRVRHESEEGTWPVSHSWPPSPQSMTTLSFIHSTDSQGTTSCP